MRLEGLSVKEIAEQCFEKRQCVLVLALRRTFSFLKIFFPCLKFLEDFSLTFPAIKQLKPILLP